MPRPFRLFTPYDFFSVFIPGFVALVGLYTLVPGIDIGSNYIVAILPILILSFVFGQAVHSAARFLEKLELEDPDEDLEWRHPVRKFSQIIGRLLPFTGGFRTRFAEQIAKPSDEDAASADTITRRHPYFDSLNPAAGNGGSPDESGDNDGPKSPLGQHIVHEQFRQTCSEFLADDQVTKESGMSQRDWECVYPIIQSKVYTNKYGRSMTFQSIYAFCRSMFTLSLSLLTIYILFGVANLYDGAGVGELVTGKATSCPPTFLESHYGGLLLLTATGTLLFWYATESYNDHFVEYLVGDFIALMHE